MDGTNYTIQWTDSSGNHEHQIICESRSDDIIEENNDIEEDEEYLVGEEIIPSTEIITISNSLDQIAAENLIYMAQDGSVAVMSDLIEEQVEQVDNADYNEQQYFECQVTEEVITDDWVQQQGEDRLVFTLFVLFFSFIFVIVLIELVAVLKCQLTNLLVKYKMMKKQFHYQPMNIQHHVHIHVIFVVEDFEKKLILSIIWLRTKMIGPISVIYVVLDIPKNMI